MEVIKGKYAEAKVFADDMEQYVKAQIQMICDNESSEGSRIRIMPDVHPGKIGPIGLTMTVNKKILPGLVGIDIGCGVHLVEISGFRPDYRKLDTVIRDHVPSGSAIRNTDSGLAERLKLEELACARNIHKEKAVHSLGTLGGGNHFIEIDMDKDRNAYLTIHTGSRHLGKEVAEFYMREGQKKLREKGINVPYEMTYLEGLLMEDYLHDIQVVQDFAYLNRMAIAKEIMHGMKWEPAKRTDCAHNYVSKEGGIYLLRKGAISAKRNETAVIPANMKDGVILGTGKGNEEWNNSAPHGTGRIERRDQVRRHHTLSEFRKSMEGVYSQSIRKETLDEAPFAYRRLDKIVEVISETVRIEKILKPTYSFKAGGDIR